MHVMFDTNIFDNIIKQEIDISPLLGKLTVYATHIQYDELAATSDDYKTPNGESYKEKFLELFIRLTNETPTESSMIGVSRIGGAKIAENVISTESSVFNVSRYGMGKFSTANLCKEIWQKLDEKKKKPNNPKDALIAETSIKNGFVLITHDGDLYDVVKSIHGNVMRLEELTQKVVNG